MGSLVPKNGIIDKCGRAVDGDAATVKIGLVARDRVVSDRYNVIVIDATTTDGSKVVRNNVVGKCGCAVV